MKTLKTILTAIAIALVTLTSCSKDNDIVPQPEKLSFGIEYINAADLPDAKAHIMQIGEDGSGTLVLVPNFQYKVIEVPNGIVAYNFNEYWRYIEINGKKLDKQTYTVTELLNL